MPDLYKTIKTYEAIQDIFNRDKGVGGIAIDSELVEDTLELLRKLAMFESKGNDLWKKGTTMNQVEPR